MLNRLPKDTEGFAELLSDLGLQPSDAPQIAKALGVSERTVWRWFADGAPKTARLSLWWLSREGHSVWDCEMHNRTQLAISTNESLWREIRQLREQIALMARSQAMPFNRPACANDQTAYA